MAYRYEPPHPAQHLQLDLFPALVTDVTSDDPFRVTAEGTDNRVIVTDSHLYVFRDGTEAPDAFIVEPITSFTGSSGDGYTIALADGVMYHVIRAESCGCGSRLRGFHPFPGVPYARVG